MYCGVHVPNFGPYGDARTLAELAHEAEEAGWDGFFLWDTIATGSASYPLIDPWIALAAIALRTQRVRLGALVTPLPRRRPWKVARETVSLDHLSGGRLIVGVGIGVGSHEYEYPGEASDPKVCAAMLDEELDVLTGLWSGEPFHYDGVHYHVREA